MNEGDEDKSKEHYICTQIDPKMYIDHYYCSRGQSQVNVPLSHDQSMTSHDPLWLVNDLHNTGTHPRSIAGGIREPALPCVPTLGLQLFYLFTVYKQFNGFTVFIIYLCSQM